MRLPIVLSEIVMLSLLTYAGVAVRYWLDRFAVSVQAVQPRSPIYPDLLPNLFGCCWMGLIVSMKDRYFVQSDVRKIIFLSLTTGFAGSLTTFSGWNGYASLAVTRHEMAASIYLMVLLISFSLSIVALVFGRHLSELMHFLWRHLLLRGKRKPNKQEDRSPSQQNDEDRQKTQPQGTAEEKSCVVAILYVGYALSLALTIVWIVLTIVLKHSRAFWLALLLGPIGTYLRFTLGKFNPMFPKFPLFTFAVNIFGTCLYAAMILVYHHKTGLVAFNFFHNPSPSTAVYYVAPAVTLGFCGSLTTVSTLVNEVYLLKPKYGYLYALISVVVAQLLLLAINLPYWKTR